MEAKLKKKKTKRGGYIVQTPDKSYKDNTLLWNSLLFSQLWVNSRAD